MPKSFIIEGLDRLGKSTLVEDIKKELGFFQVIHYQKPEHLKFYDEMADGIKTLAQFLYQQDNFIAMFQLLKSDAHLILDRAHLGEYVYAPMYRKYDASYIWELEGSADADEMDDVRLILLTEDFSISNHFKDDGESLGTPEQREEEQKLFVEAFDKSIFPDKRIICVTDPETGHFKSQKQRLKEALA